MSVDEHKCMECSKCRFLHLSMLIQLVGECRYHAPEHGALAAWPHVSIHDWCGNGELRGDLQDAIAAAQPSVVAKPIVLEGCPDG